MQLQLTATAEGQPGNQPQMCTIGHMKGGLFTGKQMWICCLEAIVEKVSWWESRTLLGGVCAAKILTLFTRASPHAPAILIHYK